jgi:hypothetical protein
MKAVSGSTSSGNFVKYGVNAVYDALATWDGLTPASIWFHEVIG